MFTGDGKEDFEVWLADYCEATGDCAWMPGTEKIPKYSLGSYPKKLCLHMVAIPLTVVQMDKISELS